MKTGPDKKENELIYDLTETLRNIFGFRSLDINSTADGKDLQLAIDRKSYLLSELGSGLAQFVVVLGTAAAKRPGIILIDEPEMNLHPALQVEFLSALATLSTKGVLFATHSLGLAKSTSQNILTVLREGGHTRLRPFEATSNLAEFLGEMSFLGHKEIGFDSVLLVEGITDALVVRQFLRKLKKDGRVLILPLGGSALINGNIGTELNEIQRISPKLNALIDSEKSSEGAALPRPRREFLKLCEELNIHCHILERRAIENYLSSRAIAEEKGAKYRALRPFELLKDVENGWAKSDSWRIARRMDASDLDRTDLGPFLHSL